jgi:hypothetical protein
VDAHLLTIAFCSGRRRLVPVVEMLVCRLRALRYPDRLRLRLVVVWDRAFEGGPPPQSELRRAYGVFEEIRWLEPSQWRQMVPESLHRSPRVRHLLARPGHAARRNLALLDAVVSGASHLLFLDDDEYFVAPWRDVDGQLRWRAVDPLAPHLDGFHRGAQITNGAVLGQPSPIPRGLARRVPEVLLRRLGEALSPGSEFIDTDTFVHGRLCLAPPVPVTEPRPPATDRGVLRLTGGNLALDLDAVRAGRVPPFFAPPRARGEDALFGARVHHLGVLRVPAYVFHDPFELHLDVTAGARPAELTAAPVSAATVERFGAAFLGWLRYAPLLLRLRDDAGYEDGIERMRATVSEAEPALVAGLHCEAFARARRTLHGAHRRSGRDRVSLDEVDPVWRVVVSEGLPAYRQRVA